MNSRKAKTSTVDDRTQRRTAAWAFCESIGDPGGSILTVPSTTKLPPTAESLLAARHLIGIASTTETGRSRLQSIAERLDGLPKHRR
jgi:hypothetical protein